MRKLSFDNTVQYNHLPADNVSALNLMCIKRIVKQ